MRKKTNLSGGSGGSKRPKSKPVWTCRDCGSTNTMHGRCLDCNSSSHTGPELSPPTWAELKTELFKAELLKAELKLLKA